MNTPHVTRRRLMAGALGAAAAGGVVLAESGTGATAATAETTHRFEGAHQSGILTASQAAAAVIAFDVTAQTRGELTELFRTLTEQARFLMHGGTPVNLGISAPPSDNGVLGPVVPADGLSLTFSVGRSLFIRQLGFSAADIPAKLTTMSEAPFPNDALQTSMCDGDLLVQICAEHADTVNHALRQIMAATRGGMAIRWRQDGFRSPPRPSGTPRNLMGFKDGIANPAVTDAATMNSLVWARGGVNGEPQWVTGGTYHVVRVIRMLVEFWDRVNLREQENMIGRRKDTGAPNTGGGEFSVPDYTADPAGESIPLIAHIRVANPRTPATADSRILRRSYNFDNGTFDNGELDSGLLFVAFNQDLERQFKAVQTRLIDEPLVDYIEPVGGGYFFALPGVTQRSGWLGQTLLT